tara:strand:- start:574 stop:1125 length:552 start_codon:yes stop_codon:yes gene_type:complete
MDGMTQFERVKQKATLALTNGHRVDPTFMDVIPDISPDGTVFIELLGDITLTGMNALLLAERDVVLTEGSVAQQLRERRKHTDLDLINNLSSLVDDQDIDITFPIVELGGAPESVIGTKVSFRDSLANDIVNLLRFNDDDPLTSQGYTLEDAVAALRRCSLYATPLLHKLQRKLSQRAVDEAW